MDPIAFNSASELASLLRARDISAVELLEHYLARVQAHNPALNAVVTLDRERALARAREADAALARGESWGPLHGVPVTIKDAIATAGLRTTGAYEPLAEHVPAVDATAVARLKAAGAIVFGKTNLPVLSGDYQSDNPIFGRTNNPWHVAHGPGGSSGGSAAAIAAGLTALELGSDYSGSIRIPAHYCGVYGLRPSEWRVPTTGHIPPLPGQPRLDGHVNTIGPLARSLDDIELALRLIAGPDGQDWQVPPAALEPARERPLAELRLAWTDDFGVQVSAETAAAIHELAWDLDRRGARIEQRSPVDDGADLAAAWETIFELAMLESGGEAADDAEALLARISASSDPDDPPVRGLLRGGRGGLADYLAALARRHALQSALARFFDAYDALLCPVAVCPAIPHWPTGTAIQVDGRAMPYWLAGIAYTCPFSVAGYPAVIIPLARSSAGLPIGLQIVGPRWGERQLLDVARQIDVVAGGFQRPPGF
jgi:amidase